MKKSIIIIIALAVALFFTALVLVTTILGPNVDEFLSWFKKDEVTYDYSYSAVPTTISPIVPQDTEAWVDINAIAGDLATASDSDTSSESLTLAPIVIGTDGANGLTSIVYIDQFGNIVDPNTVNNNKTTTRIDNDIAFDDTVATSDDGGSLGEYEINSAGIITNYFGISNIVIIPPKIQGKTVKGIGRDCFESRKITSVQIPETVQIIEAGAFRNCDKLERVVFVNQKASVEIGNSAFKGCKSLKSINLPITPKIGISAFESCSSLTTLDIKKGTKEIGQWCFAYCTSLTSITFRDESTVFSGISTFQDCKKDKLIVYCEVDSNVEQALKGYGLNTSPIAG